MYKRQFYVMLYLFRFRFFISEVLLLKASLCLGFRLRVTIEKIGSNIFGSNNTTFLFMFMKFEGKSKNGI